MGTGIATVVVIGWVLANMFRNVVLKRLHALSVGRRARHEPSLTVGHK